LEFVRTTAAFDVHMAGAVTNHGVPEELLQRQFRESAAFFAQPLEEKLKLQVSENALSTAQLFATCSVLL